MGRTLSCELVGLDEMVRRLEDLGAKSEDIMNKALYAGLKVMADGLKEEIRALPEDHGYKRVPKVPPRNVVGSHDKNDLISHMGISHFRSETGRVYARISFNGYGEIKTKKYPNGRPVVLIARAINSGSSVRMKHPFIKPAIAKHRDAALDAMRRAVEQEINNSGG